MIKLLFALFASTTIFMACSHKPKTTQYTRIVFDPGDLKFIASSLNKRLETMSALYGNEKGYQSLSGRDSLPAAGSLLKLVTWRYHDNPQYKGGKINGELLRVETVQTDKRGLVSYDMDGATDQAATSLPYTPHERIAYLMHYQPVSFP